MVPDHQREQFATWDAIRARDHLAVAVPNVPYYVQKIRELLPRADIQVRGSMEELFGDADAPAIALVLPAERGSAWTLRYPSYSVVVPGPDPIRMPLAYPIARHDERFASVVNNWISLKRKDGTLDAAYKHWILGQDAVPRQPRWSIVRNVLHWVD